MVKRCALALQKERVINGIGLIGADGRAYPEPTLNDLEAWVLTVIKSMREPTEAMEIAGHGSGDVLDAHTCWQAMIDAAQAHNE